MIDGLAELDDPRLACRKPAGSHRAVRVIGVDTTSRTVVVHPATADPWLLPQAVRLVQVSTANSRAPADRRWQASIGSILTPQCACGASPDMTCRMSGPPSCRAAQ